LVQSLGRPGGNITGAAHINVDTVAKRLELLHELIPSGEFAILTNPRNPLSASVEQEVAGAAKILKVQLAQFHASTDDEIENALRRAVEAHVDGLVIGTDPLFTSRIPFLAKRSGELRLPAIYQYRDFVAAGGAMSYGGDINASYYSAGLYVARILRGENPAELAVQLSTKVQFFMNLRAIRALGLEPSSGLVARADEVIE
jgi:putative ABC transport system substrate-binding protein